VAQIEPLSFAMRKPVMQASVGKLEDLQGILLVCVIDPHKLDA
jgi:hypothetical protein